MTKAVADTTATDELLRLVGFCSKLTLSKDADNNCKAEYYDLQGRRLSNLQKGINIVKRGNKATKVFVK